MSRRGRGPVTVTVPATSANLGPGFDVLGVALDLTDEVTVEVAGSGIVVEVTGEGAGEVPTDGTHLVVKAIETTLRHLGMAPPPALRLTCANRIPHARGLGSSSAAIVAGVLAAYALAGREPDPAAALPLAARMEGHPDNVAPCLYGGFTIAWTPSDAEQPSGQRHAPTAAPGQAGARAVRLVPAAQVRPVVYVPQSRGLTAQARAALPAQVPHRDAVFNLSRTALLVHALTQEPGLLMSATEDRLHQPYREPGMPETAGLVAALRAAGVPAMVSGAGPSVLALTGPFAGQPVAPPAGWSALTLAWSVTGARVQHASGDPVAGGRVG